MAEVAALPPDEADKEAEQLIAKSGLDGPALEMAKLLTPAVGTVRRNEAAHQTRLAMLKAAIDVVRDGKRALNRKEHQDLFGDGPFTYVSFDGGFELRSKLADNKGTPVSLTVGRKAAK